MDNCSMQYSQNKKTKENRIKLHKKLVPLVRLRRMVLITINVFIRLTE